MKLIEMYISYKNTHYPNNASQHGGALVYILMAIAMIGVLTGTLLQSGGQGARAKKSIELAQQLDAQIQFIKAALQECAIMHPSGDPTINDGSVTDNGYIAPYPVEPASSHFSGSTDGAAADNRVFRLKCPGNPGIDNNHSPIFGPTTGRFFPPTVLLNHNWFYSNRDGTSNGRNVHGVNIRISPFSTLDPYVKDALERLDAKYNDCELEYIPNGDSTNGCTAGRDCLIYWIARITPAC
jgi:type II secretory pathway pseudopilin PulG